LTGVPGAMMRDDRMLRIIGFLKVVLPLAALVLLSLVFLLARSVDPSRALPLARVDVEELARDPRVSAATYAGETADGAALTVTARVMRTDPDGMMRLDAEGIQAEIVTPTGASTTFSAETGWLDRGEGNVGLSGGVAIEAAPGYSLRAAEVVAALDRTRAEATGGVVGGAPAGSLSSRTLSVVADSAADNRYVLVFNGDVRLLYLPRANGG